jgi:hypothetical protein
MNRIAEELHRAGRHASTPLVEVSQDEAQQLRSKVVNRYSPAAKEWPLWEHGAFGATLHDKDAWRWIGEFVGPRSCYLLFNPDDEDAVFRLESGAVLTRLLSESFGFEFYVTDANAEYLLCFNHHDVLLAGGNAEAWLRRRSHQGA